MAPFLRQLITGRGPGPPAPVATSSCQSRLSRLSRLWQELGAGGTHGRQGAVVSPDRPVPATGRFRETPISGGRPATAGYCLKLTFWPENRPKPHPTGPPFPTPSRDRPKAGPPRQATTRGRTDGRRPPARPSHHPETRPLTAPPRHLLAPVCKLWALGSRVSGNPTQVVLVFGTGPP